MEVSKEKVLQTIVTHSRFHHNHCQGGRVVVCLTRKLVEIVTKMRNIMKKNSM